MPPEQQNPAPGQNPYDFIMNPQKPQRDPISLFTGGNMIKRAIIAVVGLIVLIVLYSIVSGFLNGASSDQINRLISIARTESEITRVTGAVNMTKLNDRNVINYATTAKLSAQSSSHEILAVLAARGKKVKTTDISTVDLGNDAALKQGEENGRYDQAMKQLLDKLLARYQQQLAAAYTPGTLKEKQVIKSANDQVNLLLSKKQSSQ
jgi:hypothetical protein